VSLTFQELLLNFMTAKFDENTGIWTYTLANIASNYVTGWFCVDLVSCIPIDLMNFLSKSHSLSNLRSIRFIRLLRLIRLVRILKASRIMRRWEHRIGISYSNRSLLKFTGIVFLTSHWVRL
jgi:Ion transport protein